LLRILRVYFPKVYPLEVFLHCHVRKCKPLCTLTGEELFWNAVLSHFPKHHSLANQPVRKQQMLVRMQRKGNPLTLLVGMQAGAATLENSMVVP